MRFAASISRIRAHDSTLAAEVHKLKSVEAQLKAIGQNAAVRDSDAAQLAQNALTKVSLVRQGVEKRRELLRYSADELEMMILREGRGQRDLKHQLNRLGIYE